MVTHQTIGEHDEVLSADDLAALRENLHEQLLFRREQLRQFATASRADDRRVREDAAQVEVGVKLAASARRGGAVGVGGRGPSGSRADGVCDPRPPPGERPP
ncbi:hypothetical protein, partial [Streptomyces albogriseolus]|uniref:hypothetical protein n=1 Tax=Streptomyces albogriseolus TaxID=1887 RepID=UPI003673FAB8